MTRLVIVNLPDVSWKSIVNDDAEEILPAFVKIIEEGTSGPLTPVGPAPVTDGIILTGRHPADTALLTHKSKRLDAFGVDTTSAFHLKGKVLSQYLDDSGIRCASINMKASQFLSLDNGLVISDLFSDIRTKHYRDWGIPPGSISPTIAGAELVDFRIHPEDLAPGQIQHFLSDDSDDLSQEKTRIIAKVLSENSSIHAIATHLLSINEHNLVSITYPALSDINLHFPDTQNSETGKRASWKFLAFLDSFLSRLISLISERDTIFVTGGTEPTPFWLAKGPGFVADKLFPADTTLYDIVPTALAHFELEVPELSGENRSASHVAKSVCCQTENHFKFPTLASITREQNIDSTHKCVPSDEQLLANKRAEFRKHYALGKVYLAEGNIKFALRKFKKALEIIPDDSLTLLTVCRVLLKSGQPRKARHQFGKITGDDLPGFTLLILDARISIAEEDYIEASAKAKKLINFTSNNNKELKQLVALHRKLNRIFSRQKSFVEAKEHLDEISRINLA